MQYTINTCLMHKMSVLHQQKVAIYILDVIETFLDRI